MGQLTQSYDESKKLITVIASGSIVVEQMVGFYKDIMTIDSYPADLRVMIDGSKCEMQVSPEYTHLLIEQIMLLSKKFNTYKEALVMDGPRNTGLATLYAHRMPESNSQAKVFSTQSAALQWLSE